MAIKMSNQFNSEITRADGRATDELRPVRITNSFTDIPEGSVLIECGNTRVMCTATFTQGVPRWRKDSGLGWVTAEYAMLPRATAERTDRESVRGKIGGRTHEISRLIGRCLRGVVDMKALGENQIQIDCDVLQADGGTRTASITGAYVAMVEALRWAEENKFIKSAAKVIKDSVSAVSVGVIDGTPMLDLPYVEDCKAMTDMNVAMTGSGDFIEIQGTAEHRPFSRNELNTLLDLAEKGNRELQAAQADVLEADAEAGR
ncbi:ribonuclease PH [Bifidobacterium dolichotidis]|uniref:Ribonuclease PH n=1 Tax=Bifidobacterium dolichotidis TaxID=2306976 RepID=A0A430FQH8_9BIFI|nr:ribonuclease PH [Bifidobacterium dolichotidis]RSX55080.1 ribonuclease PH [Bifidobacterium dolichotidis]